MTTSTAAARPAPGRRPDWRDDAACRDADPELFFPDGNIRSARAQIKLAKLICRRCLVSVTCLSWALASGQEAGIWGGRTEDERHRLHRHGQPGVTTPFPSPASVSHQTPGAGSAHRSGGPPPCAPVTARPEDHLI
jgi:WhiB family redox-sensing transcriptional regulator